MTFEQALTALKAGSQITRRGWNGVAKGKLMYLHLQVPDSHSKMTEPYIYLTQGWDTEPHSLVPWLASQTDLLAEDWEQT